LLTSDRDAIAVARDSLSAALTPCGAPFAAQELAWLKGLTKMRDTDSAGLAAQAYVDEVSRYPAAAVTAGCRKVAAKQVFFPAWAELRQAIEDETVPLRAALRALEPDAAPRQDLSAEIDRRNREANIARMLANYTAQKAEPPAKREPPPVKANTLPPEHGLAYTEARNAGHGPVEAQRIAGEAIKAGEE
jgi:hypothetical protein